MTGPQVIKPPWLNSKKMDPTVTDRLLQTKMNRMTTLLPVIPAVKATDVNLGQPLDLRTTVEPRHSLFGKRVLITIRISLDTTRLTKTPFQGLQRRDIAEATVRTSRLVRIVKLQTDSSYITPVAHLQLLRDTQQAGHIIEARCPLLE